MDYDVFSPQCHLPEIKYNYELMWQGRCGRYFETTKRNGSPFLQDYKIKELQD